MSMLQQTLSGRYRLEERIATGGMGAVWRAHDELLERPVAIKLLHHAFADDPIAEERFRREALIAASISHPHMANVFDYIEDDGRPGIVMELVDGETLADRLARGGALPALAAVPIISEVLDALGAAHARNVIHRDIKPANILLSDDLGVKVADFGIARSTGDTALTSTGTVMGTAHYAAPEQVRGEAATPRTDLYSTGVVLYEMLTGTRPFDAETPIGIATKKLSEDPAPLRAHRAEISPALEAVILKAMERAPQDRFASAAQMREGLDAAMAFGTSTPATTAFAAVVGDDPTVSFGARPPLEHAPLARTRRRLLLWFVPLVLVATLVATALTLTHIAPDAPAPPAPAPSASAPPVSIVPACCEVPDVRGLQLKDARALIENVDLQVGEVTSRSSSRDRGTILSQQPSDGSRLNPGDEVDLVVADTPEHRGKRRGNNDD